VPTVTLLGQSHAGRVSASLMHAVGIPEWIASDTDAYTQRAIDAHASAKRSASDRQSLRQQLASSPLCDEHEYASRIATAFTSCWSKWCKAKGGA